MPGMNGLAEPAWVVRVSSAGCLLGQISSLRLGEFL